MQEAEQGAKPEADWGKAGFLGHGQVVGEASREAKNSSMLIIKH